jgi:peptide/nickel transport system substrate-binding protein
MAAKLRRLALLCILGASLTAACGPRPEGSSAPGAPASGASARFLAMAFRYELTSMSPKTAQAANGQMNPLFNAGLAILDGGASPQPQLVEALPQLHSDSWIVAPDGRMQTTYRLRPGLTWHDGHPLTADDFVFAMQVYGEPGLAFFPTPQDRMEQVLAADPNTVVIHWRSVYPDAAALALDFVPLPRHLMEQSYAAFTQDGDAQAFLNLPYWTAAFVGAGPYRLGRWEPGVQLEATAFAGYALGAPRIGRLIIHIIGDENTALANVMTEQVHFAMQNTLRFEHGSVLKREWAATQRGIVHFHSSSTIVNVVQFRPEYQKEPALLDVRVRRALAHGIDKQALQDGLYEGEGEIAETILSADDRYYPEVKSGVARYPFDPRRSEQLMAEAGFSKDREGGFISASGEPFRPDFQVLAGSTFERGQAILTDNWRRAGFAVQPNVLSAVQVRDNQARATFPTIGMVLSGGYAAVTGPAAFTTAQTGTTANRWSGANRGGWSHAEYDRVYDAFTTTLDANERTAQIVQIYRLLSEELPGFPMYFDVKILAHAPGLKGPETGSPLWNIHQWDYR